MTAWQIWLTLGLIFFAFEIFTPGFVLGCLGIGAFLTLPFTFFEISIWGQLILFAITTVLSFFFIRPLVVRLYGDSVPMNVYSLVGKSAIVTRSFDPKSHIGRVKIDGDDWRAVLEDESEVSLNAGDLVRIEAVDSNTLIVQPLKNS